MFTAWLAIGYWNLATGLVNVRVLVEAGRVGIITVPATITVLALLLCSAEFACHITVKNILFDLPHQRVCNAPQLLL